ncbi:MAG: AAA family ATPase [Fuerstiella sp.]
MRWFRRIVWSVAVFGWLLVILIGLVSDAAPGLIVAYFILAVMTWVAVFTLFSWKLGLRRRARKHLSVHPKDGALLEHTLSKRLRIDMMRGLRELSESNASNKFDGISLAHVNLQTRLTANPEPVKVEWESIQTGVSEWEEIPANGVFFLDHDGVPFVAAVAREFTYNTGHDAFDDEDDLVSHSGPVKLHILAVSRKDCRACRDFLLAVAEQHNVFRGREILIRPGERRSEPLRIDFTSVSPVDRDRIILPDQVFDVVNRAAMKQIDMESVLRKAGHRTRTAVLLHGPPGTGKTLLTKYLVASRPDATTIMLHGFKRGLVREAFRLARCCQPSIVVIEDVDLIAVRRKRNSRGTTALHELLDELDGLAPESRTVVIMTTNRPDVLEPALASRPGRVSQAIEVPLPDADCRRRIFELFTSRIDVSGVNTQEWITRTEGASPAFMEELIRRGIMFASERTPDADDRIVVTDHDLTSAIGEILGSGGPLTQKLLGYSED